MNEYIGARQRVAFFDRDGTDQLLSIVLELATELWTIRERLFVLEAVSAAQGQPMAEAIEAYRPTPEQAAELARMRKEMIDNMFRTLGREHRLVSREADTTSPEGAAR